MTQIPKHDKVGFTITYSDGEAQFIYLPINTAKLFYGMIKSGRSFPCTHREGTYTATVHYFDIPKLGNHWFPNAYDLLKPEEYIPNTLN